MTQTRRALSGLMVAAFVVVAMTPCAPTQSVQEGLDRGSQGAAAHLHTAAEEDGGEILDAPCLCGCKSPTGSTASSGRLPPIELASITAPRIPPMLTTASMEVAGSATEPHATHDPIPI